ncbi:MAG TPA: hypothetical protein VGO54_07790 [Bradyrhizobium sp.]|jgi:hypothetical protein|nr:hypothetical protein [Bradyrhizobium sp.]
MPSSESKNPKRWQPKISTKEPLGGAYTSGIHNVPMLMKFGLIASTWPQVEEEMIELLNFLIFVDYDTRHEISKKTRGHMPGRQIFRSISANGVRAKVMHNLLKQFVGNIDKDPMYDFVISEFQTLVNLRNDYLHGLWWTYQDGRVFIQTENIHEMSFNSMGEVLENDFTSFLERSSKIRGLISQINTEEYNRSGTKKNRDDANAKPSAEKPPEPPSESSL